MNESTILNPLPQGVRNADDMGLPMVPKPKIFCFINSGAGTEFVVTSALSENGYFLAGHMSSNDVWAKHDIGITSDWKHDDYQKHYPQGYELVWVEGNPTLHPGVVAAYDNHLALPADIP